MLRLSTNDERTEREDINLETELATSSSCVFQSDSFLRQEEKEKDLETSQQRAQSGALFRSLAVTFQDG